MDTQRIEKEVTQKARNIASTLARILLRVLKPFIPFILIALFIFFLLAMLVAAVYSALPQETGVTEKAVYQEYCDIYNIADTWLINNNPEEPGANKYAPKSSQPYYPGKGVLRLEALVDPYGNDSTLALKCGSLHAACLYLAYNKGADKITNQDKVAESLHPYFYYKQSYIVKTWINEEGESVIEKDIQYLLVEAYTIEGHYQYHYEWTTRATGEGKDIVTIQKEELKDVQQILPNKWQRLEDWMVEEYQIARDDDELRLARTAVWEAGNAFNEQTEWLDWLIYNMDFSDYISVAMVPPELRPFFEEAEEKYGIPWWFLAAVAFKESSFNPLAENTSSKCYGLMQLQHYNWEKHSVTLGFDPVVDRDNPRAQILCGAYMLYSAGLRNVNWDSDNWQESTLDVLRYYGGFSPMNDEERKDKQLVLERCRKEYAKPIWEMAESLKLSADIAWPVPGYEGKISSSFGMRYHPILKINRRHEGIDIPAPSGVPIISVSSGVVVHSGWMAGYGNTVVVQDGMHKYLYAHMSSIAAKNNQTIQSGAAIGRVGNTGLSGGPHLHFGVYSLKADDWIDPMLVVQGRKKG